MKAKQVAFVNAYVECWNASEAARRAGYKGRSNSVGHQLLTNIDIAAEIKRRVAEKCMTADECLIRLAEQARGTLDDFIDGRFISLDKARSREENHICPLPFDIVTRAIRLYSNVGDTVFDPFAGLFTVPYCALELGRNTKAIATMCEQGVNSHDALVAHDQQSKGALDRAMQVGVIVDQHTAALQRIDSRTQTIVEVQVEQGKALKSIEKAVAK